MHDRTPGYGTVLGIAGAAAGAVGTIAAILMDRYSDEESSQILDRGRRAAEDRSRKVQKEPGRFRGKRRKPAPPEPDPALRRAGQLGSQVATLAAAGLEVAKSKIESGEFQDASQRLATTLKDRSRESASRAGSIGSDVSARASNRVMEARHQVPGLKDAAGKAVIDARDRGAQLGSQALERLPEVRGQMPIRVASVVEDLRKQATATATAALETAESKAQNARTWAEKDALPEVRTAVTDVSRKAAGKAKEAEARIATVTAGASGTLTAVEDRSRHAASVAAQGTKDTGAIAFWATVAGGLVYYAFLSDKQREQVKEAALRIGSEAREIYRDIQGADEEFV